MMTGHNKVIFQRLGGLLQAGRLPWVIVRDFDMGPDRFGATQFAQHLDGIIRTAGSEGACANSQGRDKVHDNVVCSPEAMPFLQTIGAV
eukprot:118136-Pyramimonas_sp.AAC.1